MQIDGDIKIWTDGDKACARLYADGPEGPIIVQASAPLAPIRRRVERAFARRGVDVSGDDPGYKATVDRLARRKALRRLAVVAPDAFKRGGLASYVARRELVKRRRRRRARAAAGKPMGAKAIGPLPKARHKRRRRRRFMLPRPPVQRMPKGLAVAIAPALAQARAASARALPPAGGGGGGDGSSSADAPEPGVPDEQDGPPPDTDAASDDDTPASDDEPSGDDEATDEDLDESEDDDLNEDADDGEAADVGAEEHEQVQPQHVRAAMSLLHSARQNPQARARVKRLVVLAGAGHPVAKKAVAAMKVAKDLRTAALAPTALMKRPAAPVVALARPAPVAPAAPAPVSSWRRWLDVFAAWRQGIG